MREDQLPPNPSMHKALLAAALLAAHCGAQANPACDWDWQSAAFDAHQSTRYLEEVAIYQRLEDAGCQVPRARFFLATAYQDGTGVEQDEVQAARWYRLAAEGGFAAAAYNLADMYRTGRGGLPTDYVQAMRWYQQVLDQDPLLTAMDRYAGHSLDIHARSQFWIGRMHIGGDAYGLPEDLPQAMRWFARGLQEGDGLSALNLGVMYEAAMGVPRNLVVAYALVSQAAKRQDTEAQGRQYMQDLAQHMSWFALRRARKLATELERSLDVEATLQKWAPPASSQDKQKKSRS